MVGISGRITSEYALPVRIFPSARAAVSRFPVTTIIFVWFASDAASRSDCLCQEVFAATVIACIRSYRALFSPTSTMNPWSFSRSWRRRHFLPVRLKSPPSADGRLRYGMLPRILRRCFMPPGTGSALCSVNSYWRNYKNPSAVG